MNTKISDVMVTPSHADAVIKWESLSRTSRTCLDRLFHLSGIREEMLRTCIPFEVFKLLTVQELMDARNVGNKKAVDLILEMSMLFQSTPYRMKDFINDLDIEMPNARENQPDRYLGAIASMALEANTIAQLEMVIESYFLDLKKVEQRSYQMWKLRSPIFLDDPLTLNAIGIQYGVTREAVRQNVKRISSMRVEGLISLPLLSKLTSAYTSSENNEDFLRKTETMAETEYSKVSIARLRALCELFTQFDLVKRIEIKTQNFPAIPLKPRQLVIEVDPKPESIKSQMAKTVKDFERNKMGICDLRYLMQKHNITKEELIQHILLAYPRSIISKNLLLARTSNQDSIFETALIKQLAVRSPMLARSLVDGLVRVGSTRGTNFDGMHTDLIELTEKLCGNEPNYDELRRNTFKDAQFREIEIWLVKEIGESRSGFVHKFELLRRGLRAGINLGTLSMYFVSGPIVREVAKKTYALVGSEIDDSLAEEYSKQVQYNEKDTVLDFSFSGLKLVIDVTPSTTSLSTGTIFPRKDFSSQLMNTKFNLKCFCEVPFSEKQVSISSIGALNGLFDLFQHAFKYHGVKFGEVMQIEFDPERNSCLLRK